MSSSVQLLATKSSSPPVESSPFDEQALIHTIQSRTNDESLTEDQIKKIIHIARTLPQSDTSLLHKINRADHGTERSFLQFQDQIFVMMTRCTPKPLGQKRDKVIYIKKEDAKKLKFVIDVRLNKIFALATFREKDFDEARNETAMMEHFKGDPGIGQIVATGEGKTSKGSKRYYILMEYYGGGDLVHVAEKNQLLGKEAKISEELVRAIACVHEKKIIHRDLKPDNIVLDETNKVKVIDFGSACEISHLEKRKLLNGSPSWHSPEIARLRIRLKKEGFIEREKVLAANDFPADMWGIGLIIHALFTQTMFDFQPDQDGDFSRISTLTDEQITIELSMDWPPEHRHSPFRMIAARLLHVDPKDRWTAPETLDYLNRYQSIIPRKG